MKIHQDFKLNGKSFTNQDVLLEFVKLNFEEHYLFLVDLFDNSDQITVTTSGSTGIPKQLNLDKSKMLQSARATGVFFELPAKTKALCCLSSSYIAGKMMWVRSLDLGWHIDVVPVDSNPLQHTDNQYDFAAMLPMQVNGSLAKIEQIQKLIIGGAPISYLLKKELLTKNIQAFQTYGMTETITHIAVKRILEQPTLYKALPNVSFSIDNRKCLVINAPRVTNDSLTTNDVVRLVKTHEFEWIGRYDNVINSGGVKLFPEEIEEKLRPYIELPFIIVAVPDEKFGEQVVLLIESTVTIENLHQIIEKASLSKYENPKSIYYLSEFARTDNGKIKRNTCIELIIG